TSDFSREGPLRGAGPGSTASVARLQMIGLGVKAPGDLPEAPGEVRPEGGVAAADGVPVPALAAATVPHGAGELLLEPVVEALLRLAPYFQAFQLPLLEQLQRAEHVLDLRFDHVNHRAVAQAGIGAH